MWTQARSIGALLLVAISIVAASVQAVPHEQSETTSADSANPIMITDGVKHNVPLEEILFDTYVASTIDAARGLPYDQASPRIIERLRDAIRPLCATETAAIPACLPVTYETVGEADQWLQEDNVVIGYIARDGMAYAYPFNILNFHEIVNETLAGEPLLISYCPLCNSAIVYSSILNGQELLFGNTSALYENDLVMYDQQTDSYWHQIAGEAILGELTGQRLTALPSLIMTWEQWRSEHPDSSVLARPRKGVDYGDNVFVSTALAANYGNFYSAVSREVIGDRRLQAGETVLMIESGADAVAYPLEQLGNSASNDTLGDDEIVVLSLLDGPSGAVYLRRLGDGRQVDLVYDENSGNWRDQISDSHFDLSGRGVAGPLAGQMLTPVASRFTFWFAAVASNPAVVIYDPAA